ncbi:MAG TPA: hypothetical protein VGR81_09520 [Candidatus Acidoferrales bacterium]|nr:hypothetical protein [Candidatus Acidoferrales bacterium]
MKAGKNAWLTAAVILVLSPGIAVAQQSSQNSPAQPALQSVASPDQKTKPAAAKPAKVWTDDDITSLRTPEDVYREEQAQAAQAATAAKPSQSAAAKKPQVGAAPALSSPKTVADADKMIAWEQRDIDSQQQYVNKLQDELSKAPASQQDQLQNLLQQRIQILNDTRKEMEGLAAQKQQLEKKAAADSNSSAQPSQQQQ